MPGKLFVGNLPSSATEEQLREMFSAAGTVHSVKIITDRYSGTPRGFGFVEMDNAAAAIGTLNGKTLDGNSLRVNEAREPEHRGSGRGGSRDGGNRW
jgi:RNA recognition motif-containing protein